MMNTANLIALVALVVALLVNFAGLIWGASKITTTVKNLSVAVDKLERAVVDLTETVTGIMSRVARLEGQVEMLQHREAP